MAGMPMKLKLMPQADKSKARPKPPAIGPDDDPKKRQAGRETAPNLPERDGPAKDAPGGKMAGKPKTSSKTFGDMRKSLAKLK